MGRGSRTGQHAAIMGLRGRRRQPSLYGPQADEVRDGLDALPRLAAHPAQDASAETVNAHYAPYLELHEQINQTLAQFSPTIADQPLTAEDLSMISDLRDLAFSHRPLHGRLLDDYAAAEAWVGHDQTGEHNSVYRTFQRASRSALCGYGHLASALNYSVGDMRKLRRLARGLQAHAAHPAITGR